MKKNILLLLLSVFTLSAFAQTIAIQGVLRDENKRALDNGFYQVTFNIYEAVSGGTSLWTDTYASMEVRNGVFQANLGEHTSLAALPFDQTYYVGIAVEGNSEMTPRLQLTTFPYAMAVNGVDNKFPSTGNVIISQDSLIINQGDLVLDEGVLSLEGGNSRIIFNDGTSLNSAAFGGPAGSVSNPSGVSINADADGSGSGGIEFQINGQTKMELQQNGNLSAMNVDGFTALGSGAPKIRMALFTGVTPAVGAHSTINTGIPAAKIVDYSLLVSLYKDGVNDHVSFTHRDDYQFSATDYDIVARPWYSTFTISVNANATYGNPVAGFAYKLLITYIE